MQARGKLQGPERRGLGDGATVTRRWAGDGASSLVELDGKSMSVTSHIIYYRRACFIDLYTPSRRGKCTRVACLLTVTI